jgi:anti-sigma B factor antagonist
MALRLRAARRIRRPASTVRNAPTPSPSIRSITPPVLERFSVETSTRERTRVIAAIGELDAAAVPVLETEILDSIRRAHAIVLDLERLTFVDSCGLWLITLTLNSCRRAGVAFSITRGPESLRSIFEVTGLSDVLPFVDSPLPVPGSGAIY